MFIILEYASLECKLPIPPPNTKADTKIALVGAGPASLSCATFLARMGFKNITIFEKNSTAGGVLAHEVPSSRLNPKVVGWEVKQVEDLGVNFVFGKSYPKDFTVESLKSEGYRAIFFGVGLQDPRSDAVFENAKVSLDKANKSGLYDAQTFLQMYKRMY